jgi:sugar/nucleoside kinase (ribokinase family)
VSRFDVTLAGDANLDLLLYGLPEELPLERELLADRMTFVLGGSAAITAHNLSALGSKVGFVTSTADDAFGALCTRALTGAGVDLSSMVPAAEGVATGVTFILQHTSSRRAFTYPGTIAALRFQDLNIEYLASSRHFHLSSYFLQQHLREDVPKLFATLKRAGLTVSIDTNDDPSDLWPESIGEVLKQVDILMPNEREACRLAGEPELEAAVRKLSQQVPMLVIKQGSRGAVAHAGNTIYRAPSFPVTPVDAVGAGDSFNAGFLHGYLQGLPLEDCLRLGNLAGAYSTTGIGGTAAFQDTTAMENFFDSKSPGLLRGVPARAEPAKD